MRLTKGERAIFLQVLNVKIQQGILETIEAGKPLMEVSQ